MQDIGPKPQVFDIETETKTNTNYRTTAWTGKYLQVTLMSIPVGSSIGWEVHPETDQFLRLEAGSGVCKMGPAEDSVTFEEKVEDDWAIMVPAGTWHDVINTGEEELKVYAIYAPTHHAHGRIHETFEDSERDEEEGTDVPPEWTVQPK